MELIINSNKYELSVESIVSTCREFVIIEGIVTSSSSIINTPTNRLVIVFDNERTARWFSNIILDCLISGRKRLLLRRTSHWDNGYPFGYLYNLR